MWTTSTILNSLKFRWTSHLITILFLSYGFLCHALLPTVLNDLSGLVARVGQGVMGGAQAVEANLELHFIHFDLDLFLCRIGTILSLAMYY